MLLPLQGVQSQPNPVAYPQNYQQQYHPTQPGQIVIYPTSQTTPLMGDANGVELQKIQNTLQQQQRQAQQQQKRKARSVSSISSIKRILLLFGRLQRLLLLLLFIYF